MRPRSLILAACAAVVAACSGNPVSSTPTPTTQDPKITCPAPVSVTSATGQATAVTYGTPTVILGQAPVTTSCTPTSGSSFPVGNDTVTCTATDALQRTDQCTFTVTVAAPPKISLTRFATFGDSITWGEDGQNGPTSLTTMSLLNRPRVQVGTPYPNQLQILLSARYSSQQSSLAVLNGGCPGESAANVTSPCPPDGSMTTYSRFTSVIGGGAYQAVLIMEGSNDLDEQSNANGDTSYPTAALANIRSEIEYAKSLHLHPYLATVPPMNPLAAGPPARRGEGANFVPAYNQQLTTLASSEGITLVDVYSAIYGQPSWNSNLIGPDGLHPTQAGYNIIAQTFFSALESTLEVKASSLPKTTAPLSSPARTGSSATKAAAGPGSPAAARKRP